MPKQIIIVIIGPDGKVTMQAQSGTYEQGVQNFRTIVAGLQANGVQIPEVSQVEMHRHGDQETEFQRQAHNAAHTAGYTD